MLSEDATKPLLQDYDEPQPDRPSLLARLRAKNFTAPELPESYAVNFSAIVAQITDSKHRWFVAQQGSWVVDFVATLYCSLREVEHLIDRFARFPVETINEAYSMRNEPLVNALANIFSNNPYNTGKDVALLGRDEMETFEHERYYAEQDKYEDDHIFGLTQRWRLHEQLVKYFDLVQEKAPSDKERIGVFYISRLNDIVVEALTPREDLEGWTVVLDETLDLMLGFVEHVITPQSPEIVEKLGDAMEYASFDSKLFTELSILIQRLQGLDEASS